jgi:HlyD family secretion protein
MKIIFDKLTLRYLVLSILVVFISIFTFIYIANAFENTKTESVAVNTVSQKILATGIFAPQNQAVLNFQTGGKLIYLPLKEGDKVYQGQTIASLDTYNLQKQLQLAANSYQIAKNNAEQVQELQQAGVLEGQQRISLDTTNKNSYSAITENTVIYDNVKRIVDNALISQNSAQINVDIANYAISLANLISPINGILLKQDVTTPNVNITPATTFIVADPSSIVFAANVNQQDIDFIAVGNKATVYLNDNLKTSYLGVVDKIYPQKTTLPNGDDVYRVDIKIDNLPSSVKFGQAATVLINSNFNQKVILVPTWTVLSRKYIWVLSNGKPVLKKITVGDNINGQTEVLKGISDKDKVITNPQNILNKLYQIL